LGKDVASKNSRDEVALRCHELLDTLLETIGIHSQDKNLVLESLALRLRGSGAGGNIVVAEIQADSNQHLLEKVNCSALSSATLQGIVTEHLDDAAMIRFNVGGESEEREFFWRELSAQPETLPVGTIVVGETRLLRAPKMPSDDEVRLDMNRMQQEVEKKLKTLGIDPDTPVGLANDDTKCQRSSDA
jgi:hypothetical protein